MTCRRCDRRIWPRLHRLRFVLRSSHLPSSPSTTSGSNGTEFTSGVQVDLRGAADPQLQLERCGGEREMHRSQAGPDTRQTRSIDEA